MPPCNMRERLSTDSNAVHGGGGAQAKGDGAGQERMLAGATLLEACEGLRHHYVSYAHHVHGASSRRDRVA